MGIFSATPDDEDAVLKDVIGDWQPYLDRLQANAVRFLLDGGENEAASILLSCTFKMSHEDISPEAELTGFELDLFCPRSIYDRLLHPELTEIPNSTLRAIRAAAPDYPIITKIVPKYQRVLKLDENWRDELADAAQGKRVSNQVPDQAKVVQTWNNLRFRSVSEVRIAEALDKAGALFFPNCRCRLTTLNGERKNVEPDFLVIYQGKWGILEVDGEPFHPPSRTVQDHERDRLFINYRILVVQHFDAEECFENADGVVKRFLDLLKKS